MCRQIKWEAHSPWRLRMAKRQGFLAMGYEYAMGSIGDESDGFASNINYSDGWKNG